MRELIFELPDLSNLYPAQRIAVLDCYVAASRSVFYMWVGAMSGCLALMVFIKDKGLSRKEEKEPHEATEAPLNMDNASLGAETPEKGRVPSQESKRDHKSV